MTDALEVLALLSGVPLVVLGILLLLIRPARRPAIFFGLFAILWGLQVIAANSTRFMADPARVESALLVTCALVPPTFLYLGRFVALFLPLRYQRPATLATLVMALLAAAQLLFARHTVLVEVVDTAAGPLPTLGWAIVPLFVFPFHGLLYLGMATVYWRYRNASSDIDRSRHRGVLVAFAFYASHMTVTNLFVFLDPPYFVANLAPAVQGGLVAAYGLGLAFILAVLGQSLLQRQRPLDGLLVAALAGPASVAIVELLLRSQGWYLDTVGLWRLLSVAIIVYTLARYQLFDIDLRLRWTVRHGTVASVFAAAFFAASELLEQYIPVPGPALGIMAAGVITLALRPLQHAAERFADRLLPGVQAPEHLAARREEVYRAALEGILWDGRVTSQERSVLVRLQRKLNIEPAQAKAMQEEILSKLSV